jgi:hypothetical protein
MRPQDLLELDALLGDPARWPASVWGIFKPPEGGLPASYRRHGAQRMGRDWLDAHGYGSVTNSALRGHIRYDVAHVPRDVAELYQLGLIRSTHANRRIPADPERLDATAALRYFNLGIQSGITAHQLLIDRLNGQIERGEQPDSKLLLELVKQGAAFAKTQATLQAKGLKFGDKDDEDDGFRGSDEDKPGPRIGHGRERTMEDGTRRHVRDEGPADRAKFNARAEQEGRPPLS